jgi:hypothetical protein
MPRRRLSAPRRAAQPLLTATGKLARRTCVPDAPTPPLPSLPPCATIRSRAAASAACAVSSWLGTAVTSSSSESWQVSELDDGLLPRRRAHRRERVLQHSVRRELDAER